MKKTILIAEDDDIVRESIIEVMEDIGWSVIGAENGADAVEKFKVSPTDIVLTDLTMPKMDGMELIREIRTISPITPVIVLTGDIMVEKCREALTSGAADFLQKPCDVKEMCRIIERAHDARREDEKSFEL